jgi:hypothetical protein
MLTQLSGKLTIHLRLYSSQVHRRQEKPLETLIRLTVDCRSAMPCYCPLDELYSLVLPAALDPNECTSEEIYMTKRVPLLTGQGHGRGPAKVGWPADSVSKHKMTQTSK